MILKQFGGLIARRFKLPNQSWFKYQVANTSLKGGRECKKEYTYNNGSDILFRLHDRILGRVSLVSFSLDSRFSRFYMKKRWVWFISYVCEFKSRLSENGTVSYWLIAKPREPTLGETRLHRRYYVSALYCIQKSRNYTKGSEVVKLSRVRTHTPPCTPFFKSYSRSLYNNFVLVLKLSWSINRWFLE